MVVYENYSETLVRAYSDSGFYIERDGVKYEDAIDPKDAHRVYTETDEPIQGEATDADKDAALETLGVDMTEG